MQSGLSAAGPNGSIQQTGRESTFGDTGEASQDAPTVVTTPKAYVPLDPKMFLSAQSGVDSDIRGFLERPRLFTNFTFASTDGPTTFGNVNPLKEMLALEPYYSKLSGRHILRCNIKLTLQINATKFQAGRYILAWVPSGGAAGDAEVNTGWLKMHRHCLTQITQLHHVEIDINKDSQCELVIPYVNYQTGMVPGTVTTYGDVGWIFAYPYWPVTAVAGSTTLSGSLWFQLLDVQLGGITVPQMAFENPLKDVVGNEQKKVGPVESTMSKISLSAGMLSKIPLLSAFAGPTTWGAKVLADVASVWGWSRPLQLQGPIRTYASPMAYNASHDVIDTAQPISLMADNHVATMTGVGGTDIDELSIDHLKAIPAYFATYTWATTDNFDAALISHDVSPWEYNNTSDGVNTLRNYSPTAFISTFFQLWRGSMTYTFKIVKTDFHTGRLLLTWVPYQAVMNNAPAMNNNLSSWTHREIWDIREKNEFKVTIPYSSVTPWLNCKGTNSISGKFTLRVLDKLVAPATVTSSVKIIMETNGGPDMKFAVPIKSETQLPTIPFTQQMSWENPIGDSKVDAGMIGSSGLVGDGLLEEESCIGEHVTSLRSFLKRYTALWYTNEDALGDIILPFMMDVGYIPDAATPVQRPTAYQDNYTVIGTCFALARGGVRLRHWGTPNTSGKSITIATLNWFLSAGTFLSSIVPLTVNFDQNFLRGVGNPMLIANSETNIGMEASVPQYYHAIARPGAAHICNVNLPSPTAGGFVVSNLQYVYTSDKTLTNRYVMRAGADDCSFHRFVSVPPMIIT